MNTKMLLVGFLAGGALAYFRVKNSPTPMTQQAKGFS